MFTDFQNFFTVRLSSKLAIKSYLKSYHALIMLLHYNNNNDRLTAFATLLCEISVFKKLPCLRSKYRVRVRVSHSENCFRNIV